MKTKNLFLLAALIAVPVAWQLNERRVAGEAAKRMQTQLLAVQSEHAGLQTKIERLRASFGRLEESLAQANEAAAQAAASAQACKLWKKRLSDQLMAADYQWPEDSPLVRIPKSVLPELNKLAQGRPFSPPGVVNPDARELMGLTPAERQAMEDALRSVADLQRGEKAEVYELDNPLSGRMLASKAFFNEPSGEVGAEAEQRLAQMLTEIRGILGEERWPLLPAQFRSPNCEEWNRVLIPAPWATINAWVETDGKSIPTANWTYIGDASREVTTPQSTSKNGNVYSANVVGYVNQTAALSAFLPDGDPNQTKGAANFDGVSAPEPVRQRAAAWFQEQATARLGSKEKP